MFYSISWRNVGEGGEKILFKHLHIFHARIIYSNDINAGIRRSHRTEFRRLAEYALVLGSTFILRLSDTSDCLLLGNTLPRLIEQNRNAFLYRRFCTKNGKVSFILLSFASHFFRN